MAVEENNEIRNEEIFPFDDKHKRKREREKRKKLFREDRNKIR